MKRFATALGICVLFVGMAEDRVLGAPQSSGKQIVMRSCGVSFHADWSWSLLRDSTQGTDCEAVLEKEMRESERHPSRPNPSRLIITFKVESSPKESCASAHQRLTVNNTNPWKDQDRGYLDFIPDGWFPRARTGDFDVERVACMDLSAGRRFIAIVRFITWMSPPNGNQQSGLVSQFDYSLISSILRTVGDAMRVRDPEAPRALSRPAPGRVSAGGQISLPEQLPQEAARRQLGRAATSPSDILSMCRSSVESRHWRDGLAWCGALTNQRLDIETLANSFLLRARAFQGLGDNLAALQDLDEAVSIAYNRHVGPEEMTYTDGKVGTRTGVAWIEDSSPAFRARAALRLEMGRYLAAVTDINSIAPEKRTPADQLILAVAEGELQKPHKLAEIQRSLKAKGTVDSTWAPASFEEAQHYEKAMQAWSQGNYTAAIPSLREAVRLSPNYGTYHQQLGYALLSVGKAEEAIPHFERATRLLPQCLECFVQLSKALVAVGRKDAALVAANKAVALAPNNPNVLATRDRALGKSAGPAGGASTTTRATARQPLKSNPSPPISVPTDPNGAAAASSSAAEHYRRGQEAWTQYNYDAAIPSFREAVRLAPENGEYQHQLGFALHVKFKVAEGLPHLKEATRLNPQNWEYLSHYSDALVATGQSAHAMQLIDNALVVAPNHPLLLAARGRAAPPSKAPATAPEKSTTASAPAPSAGQVTPLADSPAALAQEHYKKGYDAWSKYDFAAAVSPFQEAVRLQPENVEYRGKLAYVLSKTGQHLEAIVHLRKAIELAPNDAWRHMGLSESLAAVGQKEEALREADKAVALWPDNQLIRQARDRVIAKLK